MFRDYGNGEIGDDGIHDLDMAAWGLGIDRMALVALGLNRNLDSQRLGHLGAKDSRSAQFEPAQFGMTDVNLHGWFGKGEVSGDEFELVGSGHLYGEHLEQTQKGP